MQKDAFGFYLLERKENLKPDVRFSLSHVENWVFWCEAVPHNRTLAPA